MFYLFTLFVYVDLFLDWKQNVNEVIVRLNCEDAGVQRVEDIDYAFSDNACHIRLPGKDIMCTRVWFDTSWSFDRGPCDTEDWSDYSWSQLCLTGINYILKYNQYCLTKLLFLLCFWSYKCSLGEQIGETFKNLTFFFVCVCFLRWPWMEL